MFIYDLAPGQRQSPYHYEYEEEWLLVVDGTLVLRAPNGEHTLERGDVVCFPAGPTGAHQLMNRSELPARTLMFSRLRTPAVSVYPDSDKIGVWPGDEENDLVFSRGTAVPWSKHGTSSFWRWQAPARTGSRAFDARALISDRRRTRQITLIQ